MRGLLLILGLTLAAEPVRWSDLPEPVARLLSEAGVPGERFEAWLGEHNRKAEERLAAGAAEHIAYYLLQTRELGAGAALTPLAEARAYLRSLPEVERAGFLSGKTGSAPLGVAVESRIAAFRRGKPVSERQRVLREMAERLGWTPERILQTAFRFLLQRDGGGDADAQYQRRGLSADPFPASMAAVARGIAWRGAAPKSVLLAGPGAEFGSRFGLDDGKPLRSPQPEALLGLLAARPAVLDCVDIRAEVVSSLAGGPCAASRADLVSTRLPQERYDLAVATNLLVYLDDRELAVAMANLARSLKPGGCLLHNDARFAARLFGEAAGIPVRHFESVVLNRRGEVEQRDRIAVHCRP